MTEMMTPLYDREALQVRATAHAVALADLEAAARLAVAEVETAREAVEGLDLATAARTSITKTRLDLEVAEARLARAETALAAMQYEAPNTDWSLADALLPVARRLVDHHPRIAVIATAGPLDRVPAADELPVLVIRQDGPAKTEKSGSFSGDVTLEWHWDPGFHRQPLVGAAIFDALGAEEVSLGGGFFTVDQFDYSAINATGTPATARLPIAVAWPQVPTVTAAPDPRGLANALADGFKSHLGARQTRGWGWLDDSPSVVKVTDRTADGVRTRSVEFRAGFRAELPHSELRQIVETYVAHFTGATGTMGRITHAVVTDWGRPDGGNGTALIPEAKIVLTCVSAA